MAGDWCAHTGLACCQHVPATVAWSRRVCHPHRHSHSLGSERPIWSHPHGLGATRAHWLAPLAAAAPFWDTPHGMHMGCTLSGVSGPWTQHRISDRGVCAEEQTQTRRAAATLPCVVLCALRCCWARCVRRRVLSRVCHLRSGGWIRRCCDRGLLRPLFVWSASRGCSGLIVFGRAGCRWRLRPACLPTWAHVVVTSIPRSSTCSVSPIPAGPEPQPATLGTA